VDDRSGWVGVLPAAVGLVGSGVPDAVLQRWDRWFDLASTVGERLAISHARPSWRLAARSGVFGPDPVAAAWRLSRDRTGRVYPLAVIRTGPLPAPEDAWFESAEAVVTDATEGWARPDDVERAVARMPVPAILWPAFDAAVILWRDDWEVHELAFATPQAFAAHGLPRWEPPFAEDAA
jgi:type VI secretion system protein ImpM